MRKKESVILVSAVLLVTLLITLYFIQNTDFSTDGSIAHSSVINGFQLSLTLGAKTTTYRQGVGINVTLALTNVSHQALNVSFDASYPYLSFDVRDYNNSLVFSADDYGKFTGNITLAPDRSINDTFNWDTGYRNMVTPFGEYQIVGFFVTEPNGTSGFQTAPLNITVVETPSPTHISYLLLELISNEKLFFKVP
jgi:hypothetical protein